MDNYAIADQLSMLAKLMDIHGENSFKAKSYSVAAFTIEKLPQEIAGLSPEKISANTGARRTTAIERIYFQNTGRSFRNDEYKRSWAKENKYALERARNR